MGWLSAFGKAGVDGLDRYAQQRELDRKLAMEREQFALQKAQDERSKQQHELSMRQMQDAILRGQRADFLESHDVGDLMSWDDEQKAKEMGFGSQFSGGHWKGTSAQQRERDKFNLDTEASRGSIRQNNQQYELGSVNLAEAQRKQTGQVQYEAWARSNPKASPYDHVMAASKFGADVPQAVSLLYQQQMETERQRMYSAALMGRGAAGAKNPYTQEQLEYAGKTLGELPENFSELVFKLQSQAPKDIDPMQLDALKRSALGSWPGIMQSRRSAMHTMQMPMAPEYQGTESYRKFMEGIYSRLAHQDKDWTPIFEEVNQNPGMTGEDKWRIRQLLRELGGVLQTTVPEPYGTDKKQSNKLGPLSLSILGSGLPPFNF